MKKLAAHLSGHCATAAAPMPLSSKAFPRRPKVIFVILLSVSLLMLFQPQSANAQAPQQFSFQGVARDATGKILANKNITLELVIHEGSANGAQIFGELHNTSTNANGVFNLQIGSISDLSAIKWETNPYFLQIAMAYDGQPNVNLGTTQLLSVPYSLHAAEAKKWIDDEPVVQTGTVGSGALLPDVSNGSTLIWYPKNAAFRVGRNIGFKWNRTTMGLGSFATGLGTLATGDYSASFGTGTEATGDNSFASGNISKASGVNSVAMVGGLSSGFNSATIGNLAEATSNNSFAIGYASKATANESIAIGNIAESSGQDAVALGHNSKATATNAMAFGDGSEATGQNSVSFGNSTASGLRSFAVGEGALAKAVGGITIGTYNNSGDFPGAQPAATDRLFQVGHGTSADRSNAITVLRNGNVGIGDAAVNPDYIMDFGGRPRVRHNGATAGIHFNNSQNQEDGFVGMKNDDQIGFYCNNQWQFWVDNNASYSHGNVLQVSDKRLKTNITPFSQSSLQSLSNLKGYHYNWLDPKRTQNKQTGLIAQEVEKYFPLLVNTDKDGYKAVNYIGLIPHLIEAVKELDKKTEEISELKKELASVQEMNKKLSALEASVKELLAGKAATSTQTSK